MPTARIMVWNIQNFGDNVPAKGDYVPLCNFIAYIVANQVADVLVLQEVRQGGIARLNQLRHALDAATLGLHGDWYFDWVRGALSVDPANVVAPLTSADTSMDSDHHEGYAVFWNNARANDFTLVSAPEAVSAGTALKAAGLPLGVPAHAITLVYKGRAPGALVGGWFNANAFDIAAPNADGNLSFCRSAAAIHPGDLAIIGARRPCALTLNIDPTNAHNDPGGRLIPLAVYHATATNPHNIRLNVQLCGYSRQLYQAFGPLGWTTVTNAIVAGDFNINAQNGDNEAYGVFTADYEHGGADAEPGFTAHFTQSPETTVQLCPVHSNVQYVGEDAADYLRLAIDHFFYRMPNGQPAANFLAEVVDLFGMVMDVDHYAGLEDIIIGFWGQISAALGAPLAAALGAPLPAALPGYTNYPEDRADDSATPRAGIVPIIGNITHWGYFSNALEIGRIEGVNQHDESLDARTAAEFINKLVSDHLPIVFSFDWP
jgi:hypothetical protein